MSLPAIITYYQERLLYQYQKPKALATVAAVIPCAVGDDLARAVRDAYGVDTAYGAQLDIIGKYVGVPRNIGAPEDRKWFGMTRVQELPYTYPYGFVTTTGLGQQDGVFARIANIGNRTTDLDDTSYRLIIRLKIATNSMDGTLYYIQQYLHTYLNGVVSVVDNQDMTLTYYVSLDYNIPSTVLAGYLPRPMGVGITIIRTGGVVNARILQNNDPRVLQDGDARILQN